MVLNPLNWHYQIIHNNYKNLVLFLTNFYLSNYKILFPFLQINEFLKNLNIINPLASSCVGAPALKYGYVNTVTTSPGEVKGLIFY